MGKKWDKFLLLLWKNWVLQTRNPLLTFVEIILPAVFFVILLFIRSKVKPHKHDAKIYKPFCLLPFYCSESNLSNTSSQIEMTPLGRISLIYSPDSNTALNRSMNILLNLSINVIGCKNSRQLEGYYSSPSTSIFAGIQLDDSLANQDSLPDNIELNLRFPSELKHKAEVNDWKTNLKYPVFQSTGPRSPDNNIGASPEYYDEGFLVLQTLITYVLAYGGYEGVTSFSELQEHMVNESSPMIKMQRFPYANWIEDDYLIVLGDFFGFFVLSSFMYTCYNLVKMITIEKEKQLKEIMKIMGLPNWLHWTAWFVKAFTFLLIPVILIVVLLKISCDPHTSYSILTYSDPMVLLVFILLYVTATITFCFAVSVFFSKAISATTAIGSLAVLPYLPYIIYLKKHYDELSLTTKLLSCISSSIAMGFGFQLVLMYENTGEGIHWSNVARPVSSEDTLTLVHIIIMLIVDAILYLLVAIYVEAVFPGEYGVPLPWYFPFTSSYWCGHKPSVNVQNYESTSTSDGKFFEKDPEGLTPGIQIRNLQKVFGSKAAVRNLSLNMYNDQITVLLGHNGAGKTTTMLMLTGMFPPTQGTAVINRHDIITDINGVRASLGLCPQHDILFDDLTVKEHLYFFTKLKGLKKEIIKEEIEKYIELLELQDKSNARSKTLSGGMKRKLCVGIAFCGNSKVVMLDEPTSGMDPSSRRALWNLIQEQKHKRTILLTTHFMDEADLLGDRIAILARGELQCCGSSFFLKKRYGAGYRLILDKSPQCQPEKVTRLLKKYIPSVEIHGNIGSELTYLLSDDQSAVFEEMLRDLEQNSASLGVLSYGISLTTLEEVFMKVGAHHRQEEEDNNLNKDKRHTQLTLKTNRQKSGTNSQSETQEIKLTEENVELLTGPKLIQYQIFAMLMKKTLSYYRTLFLLVIHLLLIPVAFIVMYMITSRNASVVNELPKLPLSLDIYDDPITLIEEKVINNYSQIYRDVIGGHRIEIVDDITKRMLHLTKTEPSTVAFEYIVGASFEEFNSSGPLITVWFNNNPYHSPPLALGLVLNVVFKSIVGENRNIRFTNYPLPFTSDSKAEELSVGAGGQLGLAMYIALSLAFVSSFYILFYVKERVCKSKHLQMVSGANVCIFWLTAYVFDIILFMMTIVAILITFICFQEDGFQTTDELVRLFLLLFGFGVGMLPMTYLASFLFTSPSSGHTYLLLFNFVAGILAFWILLIISSPTFHLKDTADTFHSVLLLSPLYSVATGLLDTYTTFATISMCNDAVVYCLDMNSTFTEDYCWAMVCHSSSTKALHDHCCDRNPNYYKWKRPGIARNLFFPVVFGVICFIVLFLIECKIFILMKESSIFTFINKEKKLPQEDPEADSDVYREKQMIMNTPEAQLQRNYILVLKNLTKYYKNFLAVNGLSLGVKPYECFGLLGVNGAGKTTTFKMITGDVRSTYGDAWILGYSIKTQIKKVYEVIGYCPQFDALLDDLTAKETLIMFALLRGVPRKDIKYIVEKLAKEFDFYQHLHKKFKQLSGGNKRKLSTAVSLLGESPVIYLDEPTTGMDPAAKRHVWEAICKARDKGKCIVLTTHNMEECEALCTRLAIMVNGNFKCLGSIQHLKSKFAKGYTLTIKIKRSQDIDVDVQSIERFISKHFPTAVQKEKHQELLTYYITGTTIPCSQMFGILERGKKQLNIEDYSLGQSSLEQVFLNLAKLQR